MLNEAAWFNVRETTRRRGLLEKLTNFEFSIFYLSGSVYRGNDKYLIIKTDRFQNRTKHEGSLNALILKFL
jgi:hypothetical protein